MLAPVIFLAFLSVSLSFSFSSTSSLFVSRPSARSGSGLQAVLTSSPPPAIFRTAAPSSSSSAAVLASPIFSSSSSSSFSSVSPPSSFSPVTSSSHLVSEKPTEEEIAGKKFKFNLIFWGGGFVAPFLATVFYFGPKFWTK